MWYAIVIFFSAGLCRQIETDKGLRYAYTVTMRDELIVCFGTGHVDGESFITYSSERVHSPAKWLTKDNVESEKTYFKQRCKQLEAEFSKMMNKSATAGLQTFQVSTECTLEMDTTIAYDGSATRSFSFNNTHAQSCSYRLKIYRDLMSKSVKSPNAYVERRLLHYSECARLRCYARDFYPAGLEMHWYVEKNHTRTDHIAERSPGPLPQGDGLYRRHIEIVVRVGEEALYVCKIYGAATKNDVKILRWEGVVSGLSDNAAFLLALFLPAFAAVAIVALGFVWHRRDEIRPTQMPGKSSASDSAPHVGRRGTPLVDTAV